MSEALPITANPNGDLLRMLDGPEPPKDHLDAAHRLERVPSNMKRTIDRLEADGLIDGMALTEAGHRARLALDVAEGRIAVDERQVWVTHDECVPNPDNPRGERDDDIDGLADSMADDPEDGPLQPMVVATPNASGARLIFIGHRRWKAWGKLEADGRWPKGTRLLVRERRDAPGLIEELSLVENGQRVNLTNLERAYAYAALARKRNWSAPQISRCTGDDLRTVQESLKIVREATPENIAAHKAWLASPKTAPNFTWERLRDSVKDSKPKPSLDLTAKLALVLVETAYRIREEKTGQIVIAEPAPGGEWSTLRDRDLLQTVFVGDGKRRAALGPAVAPWLTEIGFDADPKAALLKARTEVVGALQASTLKDGEYHTAWLNVAAATPAETPSPLEGEGAGDEGDDEAVEADAPPEVAAPKADVKPDPVALYEKLAAAEAAKSEPPSAAPADPNALPPQLALQMVELAHKLLHDPTPTGRGFDGVVVHEYTKDAGCQQLVERRLIGFLPGKGVSFLAYPSPKSGVEWLTAQGLWADGAPRVPDRAVAAAMEAAQASGPLDGYCTPWLNAPEGAAEPAPAPRAASGPPSSAPAEAGSGGSKDAFAGQVALAQAEEAAEAEARLILAEVRDVSSPTPQILARLFKACGVDLPLMIDADTDAAIILTEQGATLCDVAEPGMDRPDALLHARAHLIMMAVNLACGVEEA